MLKLSKKYGVNPTIPVCFWCGSEKNEIALMGQIGDSRKHEDIEAPKHMVLDYEPCEECRKMFSSGFTILEATEIPNSATSVPMGEAYPTGRYMVIKEDAAQRIFCEVPKSKTVLMESSVFAKMFNLDFEVI